MDYEVNWKWLAAQDTVTGTPEVVKEIHYSASNGFRCVDFKFLPEQVFVPLAEDQWLPSKGYLAARSPGEDAWEGKVVDFNLHFMRL